MLPLCGRWLSALPMRKWGTEQKTEGRCLCGCPFPLPFQCNEAVVLSLTVFSFENFSVFSRNVGVVFLYILSQYPDPVLLAVKY